MKSFCLRIFSIFMLISICLSFDSCSEDDNDKKINIVCTAFSQYDFVKEILGEQIENFNVEYLFSNGADVHSFENDVGYDIKIKILNSDIFIYNGGESDGWAQDILNDKSMKSSCKVISLIKCIDSKDLIHNDQDHKHTSTCEDEHSHDEYDEHVWLSLDNAIKICNNISNAIIECDSENKEKYEENTSKYISKLDGLKNDFKQEISQINSPFVVVADRFPFKYLFEEFDISYSAAFSGCTSETEASYDSIVRLVEDILQNDLKSVLVLEKSNSNISDAVITASKRSLEIYSINSLQSVNSKEIEEGLSYYSAMKQNLSSIKKALVK